MNCSTGKNQYATKFLTESSLIDIHIHRNFNPDQGPQNVYQCEICGDWHLTSSSSRRDAANATGAAVGVIIRTQIPIELNVRCFYWVLRIHHRPLG